MNPDSFLPALDQALRFVRLHGWVDQTREHIVAVQAFFPEFPEKAGEFSAHLIQRLTESPATTEKLLTLVCLRASGLASEDLAELFFLHLAGKLEKRDQATLQRYFFEGRNPLPLTISNEITDRVYMTYQRAIYRALQMQSFTAECGSQDIILYFVQLLCRNDMFEQNRAMVLLLLSRIDGPVSPFIHATVAEALTHLRDVIAEVENQGEAVLTQTHHDDTPQASGQLQHWAAAPPQPSTAPEVGFGFGRLEQKPRGAVPSWSAATGPSSTSDEKEAERTDDLPRTLPPVALGTSAPRESAPKPLKFTSTAADPEVRTQPVDIDVVVPPGFSAPSQEAPPPPEFSAPAEALPLPTPPPPQPGPSSASALYEIRFNRGSPELDTLLTALQPTVAQNPQTTASEDEPQPGDLRPEESSADKANARSEAAATLRPRRFPWWGWVVIALAIGAGLAYWGSSKPSPSNPPTETPSTPPVQTNIGGPPAETAPHTAVTAPGSRVWDFYLIQKASPQPMDWKAFLDSVRSLNPSLTNPDLVFPGQVIRLP